MPDGEEELADVLADADLGRLGRIAGRFSLRCAPPDGHTWRSRRTSRTTASTNGSWPCVTPSTRGLAFGKQLSELEDRAGEIPVAIVRTTDFPKRGKAIAQIAGMLKRHGEKVVAADADWRRMLAFEAFRKEQRQRSDFAEWQKVARPLSELASLQRS